MSQDAETATASHGTHGSGSTPSQPQGGATSAPTPLIPLPDQLSGKLTLQEREKVSATNAIHRGLWTKLSGETVPVMIKVVQKAWLQSERPPSLTGEERFERRIARETSIWHATRHGNILPFIGHQLIDGVPLLVSPVCAQGDLRAYISRNPKVTDFERLELLLDAARGLAYLHNLQPPIAHGSIHPSDILVTQDIRGVLCDFGNSRVVTTFETGFTTDLYSYSRMGYSSPELIKGITLPTPMSDVYGLGGTTLSVMTGKDPFHQKRTSAQVALAIANGVFPSPRDHRELPESNPLWSLMNHCWNAEPSQRHTAAQIVYKVNLIMHCGDGLTAPLPMPVIASTAPADPEDYDDRSEASGLPLPPPLPGTITLTNAQPIARGGYGEVHRGLWTPPGKDDPIPVAVKRIKIDDIREKGQDQNFLVKRIRRETVIWKAAEHSNIVRFYGHQLFEETPTLISSWCENGDLWSYVRENRQLARRERLELLCGAGRGLAHLHSLKPPICHGDIKPQNVLISDNMEALLCDFGISRIITESTTDMTTLGRATGTAGFASKEVIEGSGPTEKGDVYAFGGLILATLTGKRPFWKKRNNNVIILSIARDETPDPSEYPELLSTDPLWNLMKRCWDPEPTQRPIMSQIVAELQTEITQLPALDRLTSKPFPISQNIQEDSTIISSLLQPGYLLNDMPDPLAGILKLESQTRVGAYSDIYKGIWRYDGRERVVCIKCLRNTAPATDPACPNLTQGERFERRISRQTIIWTQLNHPNVLPFLGYQVVDGEPRLVSPWIDRGTLETYLDTHPDLSNIDRLRLLEQAARGLAYLHGLFPPIAHGDLEIRNILVTDEMKIALCGFGCSRVQIDGHTGFTTSGSAPASTAFQAKEIIMGESLPTLKSDIYAMGGVILETISGMKPLHRARTIGMVILSITMDQMPRPADHPGLPEYDPLWPFLRRCWSPDPDERPTAFEVVEELNEAINPLQFRSRRLEGRLERINQVGRGGYSDVYYGAWTLSDAKPVSVAIKCIKIPYWDPDAETHWTRVKKHIGQELSIWEPAKHENIREFFGCQIVEGTAMLVSPWSENGNLRQYINRQPGLTSIKKLELLCDAAQGLAYLHSRTPSIIHGDITPDNIIVTNNFRGALCGFGTSRVFACLGPHTNGTSMGHSAGAPGFQAKELYEEDARRTSMGDVYTFGGVILAALSGKTPFYQMARTGWARIYLAIHDNETASPADHPELPREDPLWGLLQNCWDAEPTRRPCIDEVIIELRQEIQRRMS